jgi:hypothetical protein
MKDYVKFLCPNPKGGAGTSIFSSSALYLCSFWIDTAAPSWASCFCPFYVGVLATFVHNGVSQEQHSALTVYPDGLNHFLI